jgi:hypothetical protein
MLFPYIGLLAFLLHGVAAGVSKKTYNRVQEPLKRQIALLVQVIALVVSAYVMGVKPI